MKIRNLIIALSVYPLVIILNLIAYFAAFAITVMTGGVNVLDSETATVNQGIFNLIRYSFILIVCSFIYYKSVYTSFSEEEIADTPSVIKKIAHPISLLMFLFTGLGIQISTDAILYILGTLFPTALASYTHMMETFTGSKSILFIVTTITLAPITEELVFRGLCLRYLYLAFGNKKRGLILAICTQALLFGLYHGNLIQMVYAFIFGIVFGVIARTYKNIVPSILLHMIINGSLYLIPEGFFRNIPHSVFLLISSILLIICGLIYILRNPEN